MDNGAEVNGDSNGILPDSPSRPRTPGLNTLSLTEYSSNPTPPNESSKSTVKGLVPDEFILPNGYPDVCHCYAPCRHLN